MKVGAVTIDGAGVLAIGPCRMAVDPDGPVIANAQSVYELSLIDQIPDITAEIKKEFGIDPTWERAKSLLV